MGNKLRHEGDEVRIKVIWPDGMETRAVPRNTMVLTRKTHFEQWLRSISVG